MAQLPDPVVDPVGEFDPEHQAILADAVGLAMFVALDTLSPPERLALVLHPDVALRGDFGPGALRSVRGASNVATSARSYATPERQVRLATVNAAAGAVIFIADRPAAIMGFVVRVGRITAIDVLADPARVARLDLSAVTG